MRDNDIGKRVKLALESVNDSARHFRTVYSFYLFFALFFLINVLITDQELLFREGYIQMPIVNVSVPVVRFFIVSPLVLLILHFNLLIQALFLSKKIALYSLELARDGGSEKSNREALDSLFPMPLIYLITNSYDKKSMKWLIGTVVFISIVILPITILFFAQVQFLPYQNETFTWIHRITVLVDIGMLCWIWPYVTLPNKSWRDGYKRIGYRHLFLTIMILLVFVTFAFYVTGGGISRLLPEALDNSVSTFTKRKFDLSTKVLVSEEPAPVLLSAHYSAECIPKIGKDCDSSVIKPGSGFWCTQAKPLILNKRILVGVSLSNTILCAVKLEDANLFKANLFKANMIGANLRSAHLIEADLTGADLTGADLTGANLRRADLRGADLRRAVLSRVDLTGADLRKADLTGAVLFKADLAGANLTEVNLTETILFEVDLAGADLTGADLTGADLTGADLTGANLTEVNLTETILFEVDLTGANLTGADLTGADLTGADLTGADLTGADLTGADLGFTNGVTQSQLSQACSNHTTKLTEGLIITRCGQI